MARRRPSPIELVNVLTPITPGEEDRLANHFEAVADRIRFGDLTSTHSARWVIIGQVRSDTVAARRVRQPLRMRYLLFSSAFNSTPRDFFEELRIKLGPEVDGVWSHCVNYPGHRRRAEFHSYLEHNSLPVGQRFVAHDASVSDVRAALILRQQHIEFACAAQHLDAEMLRDEFCKHFPAAP
jgi:hypothetical protein